MGVQVISRLLISSTHKQGLLTVQYHRRKKKKRVILFTVIDSYLYICECSLGLQSLSLFLQASALPVLVKNSTQRRRRLMLFSTHKTRLAQMAHFDGLFNEQIPNPTVTQILPIQSSFSRGQDNSTCLRVFGKEIAFTILVPYSFFLLSWMIAVVGAHIHTQQYYVNHTCHYVLVALHVSNLAYYYCTCETV